MPRDLSDYVEVHVRISQFWEKHPEGRIETEILFPDDGTVRCVARTFRDDGFHTRPAAVGHAEEKRGDGPVNRTSAVENCETSAVGRALALMGFSIHKGVASREEVEIARRKTEDAKARPAPRYVDFLRNAIRGFDPAELADEEEWSTMVAGAVTTAEKKKLVSGLEAALVEVSGDEGRPALVMEAWEKAKVKHEGQVAA